MMMRKLKLESVKAEEASSGSAAPEAAETLAEVAHLRTLRIRAPPRALDAMRGIYHGSTLLAVGHAATSSVDGEGLTASARPSADVVAAVAW